MNTTNFINLENAIRNDYENRRAALACYVNNGYMPSWSANERTNSDRGLKQYSTPAKWAAYQAGTLSREKAVEIATKRAEKENAKNEQKQLEKMAAVANAPTLKYCYIHVEWVKNSYWGNNPHATATANNATTYGRASGCGYDKESASIASALNENPAALRVLYEAAEKALAEGKQPRRDGLASGCVTWRDILGYGSGYTILPYFEGGCGSNCFYSIFEKCGYIFKHTAAGKKFDNYAIEKMEV